MAGRAVVGAQAAGAKLALVWSPTHVGRARERETRACRAAHPAIRNVTYRCSAARRARQSGLWRASYALLTSESVDTQKVDRSLGVCIAHRATAVRFVQLRTRVGRSGGLETETRTCISARNFDDMEVDSTVCERRPSRRFCRRGENSFLAESFHELTHRCSLPRSLSLRRAFVVSVVITHPFRTCPRRVYPCCIINYMIHVRYSLTGPTVNPA